MSKLTVNDPKSVVNSMVSAYVKRQLAGTYVNSTAELIAHTLTGQKSRDYYRFEITDPQGTLSRQIMRGLITNIGV